MDPACPHFLPSDHDRITELEHRLSTQSGLLLLLMFVVIYGGFILLVRAGFLKGLHAGG